MAVIRFTSEFSAAPQSVNVWHFDCHGAATTSLANECITKVDTFYEAIKALLAPGTWTHGQRVITVDQLPNVVVPATALTTTTTAVSNAPFSVCCGVTWTTAFIGKSYRGRTYLGPMGGVTQGSDGLSITSSAVSTIATATVALYTATAGGAVLTVWSQKLQVANDVTGSATHSGIRTQRRRLT